MEFPKGITSYQKERSPLITALSRTGCLHRLWRNGRPTLTMGLVSSDTDHRCPRLILASCHHQQPLCNCVLGLTFVFCGARTTYAAQREICFDRSIENSVLKDQGIRTRTQALSALSRGLLAPRELSVSGAPIYRATGHYNVAPEKRKTQRSLLLVPDFPSSL